MGADSLTPAPPSHFDGFGHFGVAAWLIAGIGALFALLLLLDAVLTWERNKRRLTPGSKPRLTYLKRFLGWLFYPSFQAYFRSED